MQSAIDFTVPYLTPPSGNHYKRPCFIRVPNGAPRLSFRLTKEAHAYYDAVAVFARGASVAPATDAERRKARYDVTIDVYLGPNMRGDEDNFLKCGVDALVHAGVIHSDNNSHNIIHVHRDQRDNPRTKYHVVRLEN
jgi:Holliday junction resolvase RusA-like endonuclease